MKSDFIVILIAALCLMVIVLLWYLLERMLSVTPQRRLVRMKDEDFARNLEERMPASESIRIRNVVARYLTIRPELLTPDLVVGQDLEGVFKLDHHSRRIEELEDAIADLKSLKTKAEGHAVYSSSVLQLVAEISELERSTGRRLHPAMSWRRRVIEITIVSFVISALGFYGARSCQ